MTDFEFKESMIEAKYMVEKQFAKSENLIKMFVEVKELYINRENLILGSNECEAEIEDMYWDIVDKYGIAMTELERYDEEFYKFCNEVLSSGNDVDVVSDNAIYCLTHCAIPNEYATRQSEYK